MTQNVLELRVHGINNAPPEVMLETTREQIERVVGDDLGSFWRVKHPPSDEPTYREAYSWGAMARTGGSAIAVVGRVLAHLGWLFVLPFGLANLAYWTRIIRPKTADSTRVSSTTDAAAWDGGRGAVALRLFGLVLTLIYVAAFVSVAVDLVAVQCFAHADKICAVLPGMFDSLGELDRDSRMAVLGIVPILAMLVIYLIARHGRVTYDPSIAAFSENLEHGSADAATRPLLATPGFWRHSRIGTTSEVLHFAASIALVLFVVAWDAASASLKPCDAFRVACVTDAGELVALPMWVAIIAALLLVGCAVLVGLATTTKGVRRTDTVRAISVMVLVGLALVYLGYGVSTFVGPQESVVRPSVEVNGLVLAPMSLVVLALALALAGFGWNRGVSAWWWVPLLSIFVAGVAMSFIAAEPTVGAAPVRWLWVALSAGALLVYFVVAALHRVQFAARIAWAARGPGIAMLLALFTSMAISSLLVLGMKSWLSTPNGDPPGTDTPTNLEAADIFRTTQTLPSPLQAPIAYERFAVLLLAVVVLALVVLLISLVQHAFGRPIFTVPRLANEPLLANDDDAYLAGVSRPTRNYVERLDRAAPTHDRAISRSRAVAGALHRGEPLLGWLAVLTVVGLMVLSADVVYDSLREMLRTVNPVLPGAIRETAGAVLSAVAIAAAAWVAVGAASSADRPLALFWDILCFFPRAGHPFAPPCYGERSVPELTERAYAWLQQNPGPPKGRVLFAAHSMGAVIAVASIFALGNRTVGRTSSHADAPQVPATDRVALLTYGVQLRAYFSRFFPSVLGTDVLGVPGTRGPSLWRIDPWQRQVNDDWASTPAPPSCTPGTLTQLLGATDAAPDGVRWRSLWRRSDYLGFPIYSSRNQSEPPEVDSFGSNPIDRGAAERAPQSYLWSIVTHNTYLETAQYRCVRNELVAELSPRTTAARGFAWSIRRRAR